MAENIDSSADAPEANATSSTRKGLAPRKKTPVIARTVVAEAPHVRRERRRRATKPVRSLAIVTMVGALIATVAIPAVYAGSSPVAAEAVTIQQVAADNAQTLVVASEATSEDLSRSSYSATTQEEIDKKKAEEAAAERARIAAEAAAAAAATAASTGSFAYVDVTQMAAGTGEVRWILPNFRLGRGLGADGYHQGVDLLADGGTPIYAAAAGVVRISQESYGGYGVAITIDHNIAGQSVSTLYGHMIYGSRVVSSGDYVAAGQLIGLVGSTGSSTANHTHFEVRINGSLVDPYAWLVNNAG